MSTFSLFQNDLLSSFLDLLLQYESINILGFVMHVEQYLRSSSLSAAPQSFSSAQGPFIKYIHPLYFRHPLPFVHKFTQPPLLKPCGFNPHPLSVVVLYGWPLDIVLWRRRQLSRRSSFKVKPFVFILPLWWNVHSLISHLVCFYCTMWGSVGTSGGAL